MERKTRYSPRSSSLHRCKRVQKTNQGQANILVLPISFLSFHWCCKELKLLWAVNPCDEIQVESIITKLFRYRQKTRAAFLCFKSSRCLLFECVPLSLSKGKKCNQGQANILLLPISLSFPSLGLKGTQISLTAWNRGMYGYGYGYEIRAWSTVMYGYEIRIRVVSLWNSFGIRQQTRGTSFICVSSVELLTNNMTLIKLCFYRFMLLTFHKEAMIKPYLHGYVFRCRYLRGNNLKIFFSTAVVRKPTEIEIARGRLV